MIELLIYLVILLLVAAVAWHFSSMLPAPFGSILQIVVVAICLIALLYVLLGVSGLRALR